ncbi:PREDICTED: uncharacterized protein LOC109584529 [Amphimedon queenslandica]|uniref:CXXC-type domain-containing protein n=1 Tax=Amphimedon queenslandica TaxID=400682 RepID=A0AAN0JFW7_AMPQE|nr:PREDICTED: uncharacterized protein LOC109584529 [Amphimedon queenslandica]XP_019855854.1 PREDICTED: uncharacterized protein LOC109584529 [Amphimedon queenslandica]|eukprot:XP_019855853.1 PREDICTED: uncharacterized protein LOC109584529 [Amphimedon queenslandica]
MNSEIEKDFDRFNDETRGKYYIEENELLKYWMEQTQIDKNLVKEMFGKKYFGPLDSDEVDSLYVWIRDQHDNGGITEIKNRVYDQKHIKVASGQIQTMNNALSFKSDQGNNREVKKPIKRRKCMECVGCKTTLDCGTCKYCKDKRKFGGPGIQKKGCQMKMCTGSKVTNIYSAAMQFLFNYNRKMHTI